MSLTTLIEEAKLKGMEVIWTCSVATPNKYKPDRPYNGHGAGRGKTPEEAISSALTAASRPVNTYIPAIHKVSLKKISVDDL